MKLLKNILVGLSAVLVVAMIAATIFEKLYSTEFAHDHIYSTVGFVALWAAFAAVSTVYMLRRKLQRRGATFALHAAFLVILAGAFLTWQFGEQGIMQLEYEKPLSQFTTEEGEEIDLPFEVELEEFAIEYYRGTRAPMDYVSRITITDGGERTEAAVSMNNIFSYKNYRFTQSGYDAEGRGTILAVSHDPWGIGVTYTGYGLLLLSMIAFFFAHRTHFRRLWREAAARKVVSVCAFVGALSMMQSCTTMPENQNIPKFLPKDLAEEFGDLHIMYNDRVCPLETYARDFTIKLYGKDTYRGLSSMQVLMGWLFYYDTWKIEPMIRIKSAAVRQMMDMEADYCSLKQYFNSVNEYRLDKVMKAIGRGEEVADRRGVEEANEKFTIISTTVTGAALKLFPHKTADGQGLAWYNQTGDLPDDLAHDEWVFMRKSMDYIHERVMMERWDEVGQLVAKIRQYQLKQSAGMLPSERKFNAERLYNRVERTKTLAMIAVTTGLLAFGVACRQMIRRERLPHPVALVEDLVLSGLFAYLSMMIGLRGYISNHLPLSNGFETMQFMAWCSLAMTLAFRRKYLMVRPFGALVAGLTLIVSMLGVSNPQVTQLMPVLESPLLSIHVVVIMIAYALLTFVMLNGVASLVLYRKHRAEEVAYLKIVSELMLYPAIFLLTIGIFIGAVWANVSWGRYWGWDPKETWALITMLIYAAALHSDTLECFRRPVFFHIFTILAFLSVLITYFGVNFLLGGMHSYA